MPSVYIEEPASSEKPAELTKWRNRIIGHGIVPLDELLANPLNWRVHPSTQKAALKDLIDEVGIVGEGMVNVQTGNMVDGHLRAILANEEGETHMAISYVSLTPEEEAKVLVGYDGITTMALADKEKLAQAISNIAGAGPALTAAIADLLEKSVGIANMEGDGLGGERDDESDSGKETSNGELLALLGKVTIGEPTHKVRAGESYRLGDHVLVIADPIREWALYTPYLIDDAWLAIYPGPYVPLCDAAGERRLVMVQPDLYLAGHLLDRYTDVHGESGVVRV